ncbi:hypothetical protein ACTWQL_03810 [Pseudalkalibacillus sp. R45]
MRARHRLRSQWYQGIQNGAWHFLKSLAALGLNFGAWYTVDK